VEALSVGFGINTQSSSKFQTGSVNPASIAGVTFNVR
jgi:hypothetical protein